MDAAHPWTLDELSAHVRAVLDVTQANGQVTDVPNARTIRYYTTIGLLDRPKATGRTAAYGRRHLEQLVAIKRLQATGLVLADVQREISALTDHALAKLAALPDDLDAPKQAHGPVEKRESRRERAFWSAEVDEVDETVPARTTASPVTGIHLDDGVTLAFLAARAVDDDDLEALRAALRPVVETLRARGLLAPEKDKP